MDKRGQDGETATKITSLIADNPGISVKEIAKRLGCGKSNVYYHIDKLEDSPEYRMALALVNKSLPNASLIVSIDLERILNKVVEGEELTREDIAVVHGALKGGRVYQDKQIKEDDTSVNTLLSKLLQALQAMSDSERTEVLAQFEVLTEGQQDNQPVAHPTDGVCDNDKTDQETSGETGEPHG